MYTENLSVSLSKAVNMLDSMRNTSAVGSLDDSEVKPTMSVAAEGDRGRSTGQ